MFSSLRLSLFHYRRRHQLILEIYEIFLDSPKRLLHPIEISRECGLHMLDVIEVLDGTPDIFLRSLAADQGIRKYGLRPTIAVQERSDVVGFVRRRVRLETFVFYSVIVVVVNALLVLAFASFPYFDSLFRQPAP